MRALTYVILALLASSGMGAGPKEKSVPFERISGPVVVTGTVVTGIVTPGADCPHDYWLALDSQGGKETGSVGLRPSTMDFGKYLGKRVEVKGTYGLCTGTEISVPFIHAERVTPVK